jgi:hypothetical protein
MLRDVGGKLVSDVSGRNSGSLTTGNISCSESAVDGCHHKPCNVPEERNSFLLLQFMRCFRRQSEVAVHVMLRFLQFQLGFSFFFTKKNYMISLHICIFAILSATSAQAPNYKVKSENKVPYFIATK